MLSVASQAQKTGHKPQTGMVRGHLLVSLGVPAWFTGTWNPQLQSGPPRVRRQGASALLSPGQAASLPLGAHLAPLPVRLANCAQ